MFVTLVLKRVPERAEDAVKISSKADIAAGLADLCKCDDKIVSMLAAVEEVPLRLGRPDFAGLASIIVSQQVSKASAEAIFSRLEKLVLPLEAGTFLAAGEDAWREAGLSRPKQRTLRAISNAVLAGDLDLEGLCKLPPETAMEKLVAVKGIGPWTAEVYLLFSAGHADIFPAGDLALQEAIKLAYGHEERPDEKTSRIIAEKWSPWRGVAARLLWAYYSAMKQGRDATPV